MGRYNATSDRKDYADLLQNTTDCRPVKLAIEKGMATFQMLHQVAHVNELPASNQSIVSTNFREWRMEEFQRVRESMEDFNRKTTQLKQMALTIPETTFGKLNASKWSYEGRASRQEKANAQYKIAMHTEALRVLGDALDRNWQMLVQKTEESIRVLNEMGNWEAEQTSVEKAIETLQEGMIHLGELKENWARLVRFFVGLSQLVDAIAGKSLDDVIQQLTTTAGSATFEESGKLKSFVVKKIREKTMRANQATALVHGMASTYSRISTDYLMPRVESLDTMMKFQSPRDLIAERSRLVQSCSEDAIKIGQVLGEEMRALMGKVNERALEVKREYAFLDGLENGQREILEVENKSKVSTISTTVSSLTIGDDFKETDKTGAIEPDYY